MPATVIPFPKVGLTTRDLETALEVAYRAVLEMETSRTDEGETFAMLGLANGSGGYKVQRERGDRRTYRLIWSTENGSERTIPKDRSLARVLAALPAKPSRRRSVGPTVPADWPI